MLVGAVFSIAVRGGQIARELHLRSDIVVESEFTDGGDDSYSVDLHTDSLSHILSETRMASIDMLPIEML